MGTSTLLWPLKWTIFSVKCDCIKNLSYLIISKLESSGLIWYEQFKIKVLNKIKGNISFQVWMKALYLINVLKFSNISWTYIKISTSYSCSYSSRVFLFQKEWPGVWINEYFRTLLKVMFRWQSGLLKIKLRKKTIQV